MGRGGRLVSLLVGLNEAERTAGGDLSSETHKTQVGTWIDGCSGVGLAVTPTARLNLLFLKTSLKY